MGFGTFVVLLIILLGVGGFCMWRTGKRPATDSDADKAVKAKAAAAAKAKADEEKRRKILGNNEEGDQEGFQDETDGEEKGWFASIKSKVTGEATPATTDAGDDVEAGGAKKSRFEMPKLPNVKIPSANEVKMMVAKKQMGF